LTTYLIISSKPFLSTFFCGKKSSKKSHRKTIYSLPMKNAEMVGTGRDRLFSGAAKLNICSSVASALYLYSLIRCSLINRLVFLYCYHRKFPFWRFQRVNQQSLFNSGINKFQDGFLKNTKKLNNSISMRLIFINL
jgi:hypothetical protein